jgi:hypothetical protein
VLKQPKNFVASLEGEELAILCIDLGYKLADNVKDLTRTQINFLISAINRRREIADIISRMRPEEGETVIVFPE